MWTFFIWCCQKEKKKSSHRQEINIDKTSLGPKSSYLQQELLVHESFLVQLVN